MLKIRTKEVLYEKYRTEKLLARRATRNITEEDTQKLMEGTAHFVRSASFANIS
jgi:septin family protein